MLGPPIAINQDGQFGKPTFEFELQQFLLTRGREDRVSDYESRIPRARIVHDLSGCAVVFSMCQAERQTCRSDHRQTDENCLSHVILDSREESPGTIAAGRTAEPSCCYGRSGGCCQFQSVL